MSPLHTTAAEAVETEKAKRPAPSTMPVKALFICVPPLDPKNPTTKSQVRSSDRASWNQPELVWQPETLPISPHWNSTPCNSLAYRVAFIALLAALVAVQLAAHASRDQGRLALTNKSFPLSGG